MPGLDPGIHHLDVGLSKQMDCRVQPGNDDSFETWLFEMRMPHANARYLSPCGRGRIA
jgi:hypothetical protein